MLTDDRLERLFFPYKEVRKIQDELIEEVDNCLKYKRNLIVHAPTGLGKTASTLPMALAHAIENGLTVFFLTSRHTQHLIALETLKEIKKKFGKEIIAVDLIGKKWMCPVPATDELSSFEFNEYCKAMRADNKCEFYVNTRSKSGRPSIKAEKIVDDLKKLSPCHCEDLVEYCIKERLCPYEVSTLLAKEASIVISDYYYIFSPTIRKTFFNKKGKELGRSIVIIDEGHNLPRRARDLLTEKLSSFGISLSLSS